MTDINNNSNVSTTAELTIKLVTGASESLSVQVDDFPQTTVLGLKQLLERQQPQQFPIAAQRLIFQGQILQNEKLLTDYNITSGCAIHLTLIPGAAAAPTSSATPSVTTTTAATGIGHTGTIATQLRAHLQEMQRHNGYVVAIQTLQKICENIVNHPTEEKYRKLRIGNAALKNKLFDRPRGVECVKLLGFQEGIEVGHLVLVPSAEKWENLQAGKRTIDEAVSAANTGSGRFGDGSTPFGAAIPPSSGAFGGGGAANWAAQAQAMLQNPAMAQMLQNDPRIQQMAQLNPMIAQAMQNPAMLSQSLQALQQNPAMMQQLTQMINDPNAMAQMQQMMAGGLGLGGVSGFSGNSSAYSPFGAPSSSTAANPFASLAGASSNPFAASSSPATATTSAAPRPTPAAVPAPVASASTPTTAEEENFEEDEIAEAIARSLEDQ